MPAPPGLAAPLVQPGAGAVAPPMPWAGGPRGDLYRHFVGPIMADGSRHAGAGEPAELGAIGDSDVAAALKGIGLGIESLVKHNSEPRTSKGTPQGLGREETAIVFLARACNRFNVQVCPAYTGSSLYQA
eukprot:2744636-Lingulodinium_polyedra.AAC.1